MNERETGDEAAGKTLCLENREDLRYLEAVVDYAPRLASRRDMNDPLTDWWRDLIKGLIAVAMDAAAPAAPGSTAATPTDHGPA